MLYWPSLDFSDPDCWDLERDVLPVLALAKLTNLREVLQPVLDRWDATHEPWRHYHAMPHMVDMLTKSVPILETLSIHWRRVLVWSIILHDTILVPGSKMNELCTSRFAHSLLIKCEFDEYAGPVGNLILNTQWHLPLVGASMFVRVNNALQDLDLSSFAARPEQVAKNGELLFKEMCDSVSYEEFKDGQWHYIDGLVKRRGRPFFRSPEFVQYSPAAEKHTGLILAGEL